MRINPSHAAYVTQITARPTSTAALTAGGALAARRTDEVDLSAGLERVRRVQAAVTEAPDVRADRVTELKAQIQRGAYRVDADDLARRLLG